jgi:hypothetical protein
MLVGMLNLLSQAIAPIGRHEVGEAIFAGKKYLVEHSDGTFETSFAR